MFRQCSIFRILLLLTYFALCSACGKPPEKKPPALQPEQPLSTASDINYIGGGTQAPSSNLPPEAYDSPMISAPPPPKSLTWVSDINTAVRMAQNNRRYDIMLWFRNDECQECLEIERTLFLDPDIIEAGRNWLFVKIDTRVNRERAKYYLGNADPPAFIVLDQKGYASRRQYGPVTKEQLITMLQTWG